MGLTYEFNKPRIEMVLYEKKLCQFALKWLGKVGQNEEKLSDFLNFTRWVEESYTGQ